MQNVLAGWSETICLFCFDDKSRIAAPPADGVTISQTEGCVSTDAATPPVPVDLDWDGTKTDADFSLMLKPGDFWT